MGGHIFVAKAVEEVFASQHGGEQVGIAFEQGV